MHAIACLLDYGTLRSIDHLGSDLFAPMCRQTVQEAGVFVGRSHDICRDLMIGEIFESLLLFGFLTHAGPNVRVDDIRTFDRLSRVVRHRDAATRRLRHRFATSDKARLEFVPFR